MIEHFEYFSLRFGSLKLLLHRQNIFIHHFHSVIAALIALETAEIHFPDVAASDGANEAEVTEAEAAAGVFSPESGGADGLDGGVGGAVRLECEKIRRVRKRCVFERVE